MAHKFIFSGTAEDREDGSMYVIGTLTRSPDLPIPGSVANLRLTSLTNIAVGLAWDTADDASGYKLYRDDVLIHSGGGVIYEDTAVTGGTSYTYSVRGTNSSGDGDISSGLPVAVPEDVLVPPPAPVLELVSVSSRSVLIQWDPVTTAEFYKVYDGATLLSTQSGLSYEHTPLDPESSHLYAVVAVNDAGETSSSALAISTQPNTAPVWSNTDISFDLVVGNVFSQNLNFLVEDFDGEPIVFSVTSGALPTGVSLSGSMLTGTPSADGTFSPVIEADDGFDSSTAQFTFVVAAAVDTTAPTTPELATPVVTGSQVSIGLLTPSTDASGIFKYNIQRRTLPSGSFAFRGSLFSETEFPYIEQGVTAGSYEYQCRSEDNASPTRNVSAFSDAVTAVVTDPAPSPDVPINFTVVKTASGDGAILSWQPGPSGASPIGYDLEHSIQANGGSSTGPWTDFTVPGTSTQVTHSSLPTGRAWYRLRALGSAGNSAYTSVIFIDIGESINPADFIIPLGTTTWNGATQRVPLTGGAARAVQAGDIIEMEAGTYRKFEFQNIVGTLANPVTVRPPAVGQVVFRNLNPVTSGFLVTEQNCHGVVFNGFTTDAGVPVERDGKRHGFKAMYSNNASPANKDGWTAFVKHKGGSSTGAAPYNVTDKVTHRYWHIDGGWDVDPLVSLAENGGNIGFDSNDNQYNRDNFPGVWQEDMIWEHFLCENLGGEATYFGGNPYAASRPGQDPHVPLRHIKVRHFMVYNTGGQALQFKSVFGGQGGADADTDNSCHDGVIIKATQVIDGSTNGTPAIVLNSAKLDVFNMWIERCAAGCINVTVSEGTNVGFPGPNTDFKTRIYNCVMVDNGQASASYGAIRVSAYTGSNPALPAAYKPTVLIFCNTILRHPGEVINYASSGGSGGKISNNLFIGSGPVSYGPITNDGSNISGVSQGSVFIDPLGSIIPSESANGAINLRLLVARLATAGTVAPAGTLPPSWANTVLVPNFEYGGSPADGSRSAATNPDCGAYEFT